MDMKYFFEVDPSKKGVERATKLVTALRMNLRPVVAEDRGAKNKAYLFGDQDNNHVREMFAEPGKAGLNFDVLPVMEKIRNVLITEMELEGLDVELKALDANATNQKDIDRNLLANRALIENHMTALRKMVGLPGFKLGNEKGVYNGNVEQFDKMGLQENSEEDREYFFENHYRLLHEMIAEEPVNALMEVNNLKENIALWMNDIIANKAVMAHVFVNEETGQLETVYVAPEHARAIMGKKRDFTDAAAIGYEQTITVEKMIKFIGNDFDFERDMSILLSCVNHTSKTDYTGVGTDGDLFYGEPKSLISRQHFMQMNVTLGYIEWKEIDANATRQTAKNAHGNFTVRPSTVGREVSPNSIYKKVSKYTQNTYKSYYLIQNETTQALYKYGRLIYQPIEGAEDEYSGFSIIGYKEVGKSAVEIAKPWIDFIDKNFKKFEYMVVRAKPPGRAYNYESLAAIAKSMFPEKGVATGVTDVMDMFVKQSNEIYVLPQIDGKPIGGGTQINYDIEHGLSKTVMEFQNILVWAYKMIDDQLGMPDIRKGYTPQPRETYGLAAEAGDASKKSTQYMVEMMLRLTKGIAKRNLLYIQDVIKFRDKGTLAYKWLLRLLGDRTMEYLEAMKECALHRYGITIHGFYSKVERAKMEAMVDNALLAKEINYAQWLLIKSFKSPKKAIMVLSYEQKRSERLKREEMQMSAQQASALEQQKHQNIMQQETIRGEYANKRENTKGYWLVKAAEMQNANAEKLQQMKINAKPEEINAKKEAAIEQSLAQATQ